jgi:hypothetical protein
MQGAHLAHVVVPCRFPYNHLSTHRTPSIPATRSLTCV